MVPSGAKESRDLTFLVDAETEAALPALPVFRTDLPNLRVDVAKKERVRRSDGTAARKVTLKTTLDVPEQSGPGQGNVIAEVKRSGKKEEVKATVGWNVRSMLSVTPAEAFFGTIDQGTTEPIQRRILVKRADGKPLLVKNVQVALPGVTCVVERSSAESPSFLCFRLDPKLVRDAVYGEAIVETDYDLQPRLRIPVAAVLQVSK
jgi:hypothetical protein